jgi:hypothetical protein
MFCPNCGTQTETQIKFCKSCGHKLVEHARLLENPEVLEQANAKERFLREGAGAMIGSFIVSLVCILAFGVGVIFNPTMKHTVPHMLTLLLLLGPLVPGIIGIVNLARGGFFKNFRARQVQAELERLQERQKELQAKQQKELPSSETYSVEATSVTEATTRELRAPVNRIKGEQ